MQSSLLKLKIDPFSNHFYKTRLRENAEQLAGRLEAKHLK